MLSGAFCFAGNSPAAPPHLRGIGSTVVGVQQGQLAPCNFSGMSYFSVLGGNIIYNVSSSQGSNFPRPPAVSPVPCFHAGRIGTRLRLISPIIGKLRASRTYFRFLAPSASCFSAPVPSPCKKEERGSFSSPSQGRRTKRVSFSLSFSFSVSWSFLGCFWKP